MESYSTLRLLGEGAHGCVFLAREKRTSPPKRLVCIKQLFASSSSNNAAQNEIALMKRVRHPNVVRLIDAFGARRSGSGSRWCIVMEFCSGGDLRAFLRTSSPLPRAAHAQQLQPQVRRPQIHEDRVWYWAVQLSLALAFLHSRGIWHRDVKTSNVFLSNAGFLVLGDLGIARAQSSPLDRASTVVGTPLYMAPEIWDSKPYDESCDLYALGCVLYEVCMGKTPFEDARSTPELIRRVCAGGTATGRYVPLPNSKWSSRLRGLVDALLSVDATQRPRAHAILTDSANAIHVKRYVEDRARVALRGGGCSSWENEEQAILHEQLTALGVEVGVVVETPPPPLPPAMETRAQQPKHCSGQAVQHIEREQLLWLQRERERHEQLRVALQRVQALQLHQQQQQQVQVQVQVHPQPDPSSLGEVSRHGMNIAAVDKGDAEWKPPVQTKSSSSLASSQRPSSAGGSSSSASSSTLFMGIPRHQGVALTPQANKFAQKTQSPLCRDVRVLRKHECAKAAARYRATLDTQFNTTGTGRPKPAVDTPKPARYTAAAREIGGDGGSDVAEAIAQLEAALRAQLAAE